MINCDVNENDSGKRDHINQTYTDTDRPRCRSRDKYRKYSVSVRKRLYVISNT